MGLICVLVGSNGGWILWGDCWVLWKWLLDFWIEAAKTKLGYSMFCCIVLTGVQLCKVCVDFWIKTQMRFQEASGQLTLQLKYLSSPKTRDREPRLVEALLKAKNQNLQHVTMLIDNHCLEQVCNNKRKPHCRNWPCLLIYNTLVNKGSGIVL